MVRKLSDEERHLWVTAMRAVHPLRRESHRPNWASVAPPASDAARPDTVMQARTPSMTPSVHRPVRAPEPPAVPVLAPIARRDTRRLSRGHTDIDSRLDLHGMTQAEAHAALLGFLSRAQGAGARFVLVITGKGGEGGVGVLRRQVPLWLQLPAFRALVSAYETAAGHGGAGALYVRIRKRRP
jgi:DNA-nicking Smr family endonuclease